MPNVNPQIIEWARETAGLTIDEAVKGLKINDARGVSARDRLIALESGETSPNRTMLGKMVKLYRRPLLAFYLKAPPREGDYGRDFRKLPESIGDAEKGLVNAVIRDIAARQILVRGSLEESGEAKRLPFIASATHKSDPAVLASEIENTLDFDRHEFRQKRSHGESFSYLRDLVENVGIFTILIDNLGSWHSTVNVEAFRGFALADDVAPFVAVNANDSPAAWSFTLVHELAHIWIGETGVSGAPTEHTVEKFCNDVASEFLLPRHEIANFDISVSHSIESIQRLISDFAQTRNVSNTMVAYKLHREGVFGFDVFQKIRAANKNGFMNQKNIGKKKNAGKNGGPSYYAVRRHRIGSTMIRFVERMMHEGILSVTKAGVVLGVGSGNVHSLIQHDHSMRQY